VKGLLFVVLLTVTLMSLPGPAQADPTEKVLIRTTKPYTELVSAIEVLGGKVTYQYKYVDAIAAEISRDALRIIRGMVGPNAITKDLFVPAPTNVDTLRGKKGLVQTGEEERIRYESVQVIGSEDSPRKKRGKKRQEVYSLEEIAVEYPNAYLINNTIMNVSSLHAGGISGQGVIVGVIDSGIRPGFPHIDLDGSVIGCEDFVGDVLGCSHPDNSGHGTFVAGMISANVVFAFNPASTFFQAIQTHAPGAIIPPNLVPMLGSAPLSSIYAFRVFAPTGGSPTSRILAAIDRLIELRVLFDAGDPAGVNIQVCNMSLGGPTVFAGRDLFDTFVNTLLDKDIVLVVSAGNAGPSSLTVGSPGSSFGAITVGAASHAHNERILRDLQFGLGIGLLFRPFDGTQSAFFSSRGPNADGRIDPDVTANGFASFGQGFFTIPTSITIGSGTSFSAPSVSGLAALLRQAFPGATARQVRNAIIASANPSILTDGSTELDQGHGFVDAQAAFGLLAADGVPDSLPAPSDFVKSVKVNVEKGTFLDVRDGLVVEHASNLLPGERADVLYRVQPNTNQVIVQLFNVTPALPLSEQNVFFGDDILLTVHSAKTSAIGQGDYFIETFTTGGTFVIDNPETGLLRVTLNGDWTNAGPVSVDVAVFSVNDPVPQFTTQGKIGDGAVLVIPVSIPAGVSEAEFRLIWREDWSNYPLSDLDMFIFDPSGSFVTLAASLDDPEVTSVANPDAGTWFVLIDGFEVDVEADKFELRVSADGQVIH
jgi:subtilisin family serine protease